MPSRLKKTLYRKVRYHRWVERAQNMLRGEPGVSFPDIGLFVPAGAGDLIIDAGANIGDLTSQFARTGATVHAFEPDPLCYRILDERFANLPNVHLHHAGLMDRATTFTLRTPLAHSHFDAIESTIAASFFAPMPEGAETVETEVECVDVAEFISSLSRSVAILKMNIEGAEIPVLNRLIDTEVIDQVQLAVVQTHERLSPELVEPTTALRQRIAVRGLSNKIRLDWLDADHAEDTVGILKPPASQVD